MRVCVILVLNPHYVHLNSEYNPKRTTTTSNYSKAQINLVLMDSLTLHHIYKANDWE